ncbi:hypothetical protein LYSHEL_28430 [Lysobacter helvus]|uniref:Uncharacterized protein n=2 Tax=Lysobacteraceae TaxID=32033 RepID=A0ABN6FZ61_9GAMM|nr:hypothetical protein LYSCAS_28400 [Lysobacter caseinilyticus]BCT96972.1 hypothetical protein LYSHEL_28430 [Lysobacter helvus]
MALSATSAFQCADLHNAARNCVTKFDAQSSTRNADDNRAHHAARFAHEIGEKIRPAHANPDTHFRAHTQRTSLECKTRVDAPQARP